MVKTNAMRLLEQAAIPYKAYEYEVDENDLSGVHVAELVGLAPEQVFKTPPTYMDETATLFDEIAVSAGIRGCQLLIPTDKLVKYIDATLCDIAEQDRQLLFIFISIYILSVIDKG